MKVNLRWKVACACGAPYLLLVGALIYVVWGDLGLAHQRREVLGLILAATVGGGLITWLIDRRISRVLTHLIGAAQRMAEGNLEQEIAVHTGDEFEELASALNHMTVNLKRSKADLEQMHQKQLSRADRLASLGELASRIAHEIKNPLAGISGVVQIFYENPSKEYTEKLLQSILKQINRLDKIVDDILHYSSSPPLEFKPVEMNKLLEKTLFWILPSSQESKIKIEKDFAADLPWVKADLNQLEQVFLNILINAVQAMPGEGKLRVRTRLIEGARGRQEVVVSIEDTGVGMTEEVLNNAFTPFFTTKHRGTGLGLAIAHQIIEQHYGSIAATSEPLKGSTFTVTLPSLGNRACSPGGRALSPASIHLLDARCED